MDKYPNGRQDNRRALLLLATDKVKWLVQSTSQHSSFPCCCSLPLPLSPSFLTSAICDCTQIDRSLYRLLTSIRQFEIHVWETVQLFHLRQAAASASEHDLAYLSILRDIQCPSATGCLAGTRRRPVFYLGCAQFP